MTSAGRIHEVWVDNLESELIALRNAIDSFPVVSMYVPHLDALGSLTTRALSRAAHMTDGDTFAFSRLAGFVLRSLPDAGELPEHPAELTADLPSPFLASRLTLASRTCVRFTGHRVPWYRCPSYG
jgi:hypothetical protein